MEATAIGTEHFVFTTAVSRAKFWPLKYIEKREYCCLFSIVYHYDVASGSEITPCNKIDKPLVVYRFTGNAMTSITTLRT